LQVGNKYIKENSTCMYCGAPTRMHALVCKRCRDLDVMPRRPKTDNEHRIALLNAYARAKRLSYGVYIARYGDGTIQRGSPAGGTSFVTADAVTPSPEGKA